MALQLRMLLLKNSNHRCLPLLALQHRPCHGLGLQMPPVQSATSAMANVADCKHLKALSMLTQDAHSGLRGILLQRSTLYISLYQAAPLTAKARSCGLWIYLNPGTWDMMWLYSICICCISS